MEGPANDIRMLRFSTDDVPARDRLAVVREVYSRIIRLEFEPLVNAPLRYEFTIRTLPGLAVSQVMSSPTWARRTGELLTDGNDSAFLCVPNHGGFKASHLGRELFLGCGEALLLSAADPSAGLNVAMSSCLNIAVPRKVLAAMVPAVEDSFMRPIPPRTEALMLLRSYVSVLDDQRELSTPELRRAVVAHLRDLIALTLGASRDAAEVAANRGVRAARLRAVKADIVRHLKG
jgi:AraC-like DNA-binding protein